VPVVAGLTVRSICPSCHQRLDTNSNVARALEAGTRMERTPSTLELGASATISGTTYELIGLLHRRDAEGERWTEYLLYHPRAGLLWLIETDDGWYQAKVQDIWPNWDGATVATLGEKRFTQIASYQATVEFAAGAFNWQVSAGDTVEVVEFEAGRARLAMERNAEEMTWSLATQVPPDMLSAWLGKALKTPLRAASPHGLRTVAMWFLIALAVANAIPFMFANDDTWLALGLAAAAIYFPAKWLEPSLEDDA
ncbi:MAG: DUF4178 domain-containing protein, partial [Pseudomonadota bacterium]|nr:DUF4178 domain-containing protein [Pseudomonadota bacterium]